MKLPSESIVLQHDPLACAYYSLINLYLLRGLTPPTYEQLREVCADIRQTPATDGLTPVEQMLLLHRFKFPALAVVGAIPIGQTARDVFPPFVRAGCHVIVFFNWRTGPRDVMLHSVVIERMKRAGFVVLDSTGGYEEGSTIELDPWFTDEDVERWRARRAAHPHGVRRVLPFVNTVRRVGEPGVYPYFVAIYPSPPGATSCARTRFPTILKMLLRSVSSRYLR